MGSKILYFLSEFSRKVPLPFIAVAYLGYVGYQYYQFNNADDSPLIIKRKQTEGLKPEIKIEQEKLKKAAEFYRTLEVQKAKLRGLALQLAELKGTLSEDADIESYLKIPLTEAAKFGLRIRGRKTGSMTEVENYSEQTHDLQFRGAYVQVLAFFERLTNLQKIIRVEGFHFKPVGHQLAKAVELEGKIVIKTYNYKPTKADALGTSPPEATSGAVNAPSSTTPEKGNEKGTH